MISIRERERESNTIQVYVNVVVVSSPDQLT